MPVAFENTPSSLFLPSATARPSTKNQQLATINCCQMGSKMPGHQPPQMRLPSLVRRIKPQPITADQDLVRRRLPHVRPAAQPQDAGQFL
jgi:hypothetical protein